jgi:hypothetical protein
MKEDEAKRLRAADLISHLERMRPHVESNGQAMKEWESAVESAKKLLADLSNDRL